MAVPLARILPIAPAPVGSTPTTPRAATPTPAEGARAGASSSSFSAAAPGDAAAAGTAGAGGVVPSSPAPSPLARRSTREGADSSQSAAYEAAVAAARQLLGLAARNHGNAAPLLQQGPGGQQPQPQQQGAWDPAQPEPCFIRMVLPPQGNPMMAVSAQGGPMHAAQLAAMRQQQQGQGQQQNQRAEYVGVVVSVSLVQRSPGCLALLLGTLGCEPAVLLHNATPHALRLRELAPRCVHVCMQCMRYMYAPGHRSCRHHHSCPC